MRKPQKTNINSTAGMVKKAQQADVDVEIPDYVDLSTEREFELWNVITSSIE